MYPQDHESGAPWRLWGDHIEDVALEQMRNACRLPVAVRGALMPDAHPGYGLPVGGVLATNDAVIPYAVGVDIACRMKLSVFNVPAAKMRGQEDRLRGILKNETLFGVGAAFRERREHGVMDADWATTPVTARLKDKAWGQLGTSGSGNHFVEFGVFEVADDALGPPAGSWLALLSHSGSRGTGAAVAKHYSRVAMDKHPELSGALSQLAWLSLRSDAGLEYWRAMELMGLYAAANHDCIHRSIRRALHAKLLLDVENHHNFAWREEHFGQQVVVHRKGATPAGAGVLGIIPGSMATPSFVVRGRGEPESLSSAAHGAGRAMSRTAARNRFTWSDARPLLEAQGVTLISAGIDEAPMAYKDIHAVMAAQADLVEVVARFHPRMVKMAPAGERPED
jgi:tRNA-splicing ligase RtcB (3'-phosphate/5'-hydroxy nucleic acid ligase)